MLVGKLNLQLGEYDLEDECLSVVVWWAQSSQNDVPRELSAAERARDFVARLGSFQFWFTPLNINHILK